MFDYRVLQADAERIQARITELMALPEPSDSERDELMAKTGELAKVEEIAGKMRDAELEELRARLDAGQGSPLGVTVSPEAQEIADFKHYLKTGEIRNASLSTTDANGGYIVPEPAHAELIEKVRLNDPIFGNATVFRLTGDPTIVLPYKSAHGVATTAAEAGARSEQNAPTFTGPTLTCYEYYSDQRATQTFLDSVSGSEDMLMGWMAEDIQEQAGYDATVADGSTKIEGLFYGTAKYTTKLSGSAGALVNTNFLTVMFALPVKYRRNAVWLMNGTTLATVAALAYPSSTASVPLATQNQDGDWVILGKKVVESDSAPAIGASAYPVAFADIAAAYAVGIHRSTSVLRDPYTATPKVRFYALARLGGCAWDYQAAILLKSNNS